MPCALLLGRAERGQRVVTQPHPYPINVTGTQVKVLGRNARTWLGVLNTASLLLSLTTSHAKPEPKRLVAASLKFVLNVEKLPKVESMALDRGLPAAGALVLALAAVGFAMHLKKNAWFHAPPALFLHSASLCNLA